MSARCKAILAVNGAVLLFGLVGPLASCRQVEPAGAIPGGTAVDTALT